MDDQNSGGCGGGQEQPAGLACKYKNKSPQASESKQVRMCESGAYQVITWDPKIPGKFHFSPFRCRSWRHPGPCQRWRGAQDFVRCRDGMESRGDHWVYVVLTFDQKQFKNEWAAYRGGVDRWDKLRKRLARRFGVVEYVQTWEKHTRTNFPHVNVALHNERIWESCEGDGWRMFRRELNQHAIACGFGLRIHVEPLRAGQSMTLAGYLTKLSRELTGAGTKNQVPVNAPPHFRRIRASQGLLPPPHHNDGYTGVLIPSRLLGRVDLQSFVQGQIYANNGRNSHDLGQSQSLNHNRHQKDGRQPDPARIRASA